MKRNELFFLDRIPKCGLLNKFLLFVSFLLIGLLSVSNSVSCKEDNKSPDEKKKMPYKIKIKYPHEVYSVYKFSETTEVTRTYSDSSTREYKREVNYFFTQFIGDLPENGFQKIKISCDSMKYTFTEGEKIVIFDSQDEDAPIPNFFDMTVYAIPYSREFEMTYSPYGDVAKIEGSEIEKTKKQIFEKGSKYMDSLTIFVWLKTLSTQHLAYMSDMQKGIVPSGIIADDSTWHTIFNIELDGINFLDTASVKIKDYIAGNYILECKSKNLMPLQQEARLYDITKLTDITNGSGIGLYTLNIDAAGMIVSADGEFESDVTAKIRKEEVKQKIKTKLTWNRINLYKF